MRRALYSLAALALVACGGPARPSEHPVAIVEPRYEDAEGNTLTLGEVGARLRNVRVVYVGERHDRASDHAMQAALYVQLRPAAVGLEMFQSPAQSALDAYVTREIDEATLLERAEWETRWGFDFAFYRPILEHTRADGGQLIALNAPTELTRAIGREGLDSLTEEQRASLPELDLEVAAHRARFVEAMGGHPGMTPERIDRYYTAQVVWDETMARAVAAHVSEGTARLLVLAGTMHVQRDAIPRRAARRTSHEFAIVIPLDEAELADGRPDADILAVFP